MGGTASELSGGKFGNGALTAAFARAFNGESHGKKFVDSYSDLPKLPEGVGYLDDNGNWVYTGEAWAREIEFTGRQRITRYPLTSKNGTEIDLGDVASIPARTPGTILLAEGIKAGLPSIVFGMQGGYLEQEFRVGYRHVMYHDPGGGGEVTRSTIHNGHGVIWARDENFWQPNLQVPVSAKFGERLCWNCDN